MALTLRRLNRATLARQLLLDRVRQPVTEVVRRILAVQAQEPASPYVALWNRIADFDPGALDAAFTDRTLLKSTLLRTTLHAVTADDHPALHAAVLGPVLRASRLGDRRFRATGLSTDDVDRLVPHLVAFASEPRSRAEFEALLAAHLGGPPDPGVWWALRTVTPLVHAPTGGPWSFGATPSFLAAPRVIPDDADRSVQHLLRRYLAAFGPATIQDIGQFTMLRQSVLRPALTAIADELVTSEGPDGRTLLDVPGAPLPEEDVPAPPRLLAMWDSTLLAYADRSRVIPAEHRGAVIRRNGDVLPTLLVDGQVRGVWRPVDGAIEATAFDPLPDEVWEGLAAEAADLLTMLRGRDPVIYRRYGNWWADLPAVDVQRLPA